MVKITDLNVTDVFNELTKKTIEQPTTAGLNIQGNTIWLKDCGWSVQHGKLYVRIKTAGRVSDNDVIVEYPLPTYRFWQRDVFTIRFKQLVADIKENEKSRREKIEKLKSDQEYSAKEALVKALLFPPTK